MNAYGISEKGPVRANNEDSMFLSDSAFHCLPNIYIVADGMGGHKSGEVASSKSIEFFTEFCGISAPQNDEILDFLIEATNYANKRVYELSCLDESLFGMGTTLTACSHLNGRLFIAHIGDSRAYSIYGDEIKQLTTDHTYVNELVKAGQLTREEAQYHNARNMLTRALGSDRIAAIDGYAVTVPGKKILLCSDGLTGMLEDDEILAVIKHFPYDNGAAARALADAAIEAGGCDNCTLILFDCEEGGLADGS